jgi:hypothetical protein
MLKSFVVARNAVVLILLSLLILFGCKEDQIINSSSSDQWFFESFDSGCKEEGSGKINKLSGSGTVVFSSFNDTIRVLHANAYYSRLAEVETDVQEARYGFDLFQTDVSDTTSRYMCYHDLTVFICNVSAGTYLIKLFNTDGNLVDQGYVVVRPEDPHGPQG